MRFALYIPKGYNEDFILFQMNQGSLTSRTICSMIRNFNNVNIRLHIPTLRKILTNNPDQIKYVKELLTEFDK